MAASKMQQESVLSDALVRQGCHELRRGEEADVLEFLSERPVHTVYMATLIRDNGLVSINNRGTFYGYWNQDKLDGVALTGHATIVETRTGAALAAFADTAARTRNAFLIRGERKVVDAFWKHYAVRGQQSRLTCREMMFAQAEPAPKMEPVSGLRQATLSDLDHLLSINASMAFEEGGVNPLQRDPAGFRLRIERRINQGRAWIWVENGQPIFKADVVGETPQMAYLEGIYVHPQERLKGYGKRCLTHLSSILLERSESICLTVNQRKADAAAFYAKVGFDFHSEYETIYLH